ncbi:type II toxin-antitoxin system VapC family toxin [Pleomorphomonas carboxyditropha]|uniref:Ribonuclease VapC n=1 Tax=Pleomorphomonas carboxyditropha TaxID=2023338 RepID=A0A2G9WSD9_9HYPH|nr:type II toxin-antitoxin system VapC family toxin [Pleomorphomonas carboxyditropha]PIO97626.1 PIN domain nuclease [Pleomorphomonas carboxyditropha]
MRETLVIDASVAVKWVISEDGGDDAVRLRSAFTFVAPELLLPECANILWKKVQRKELEPNEAALAIALIERSGISFQSMQGLGEAATRLAIELGHPAYDCVYLALALRQKLRFVTADKHLLATVAQRGSSELAGLCFALEDADRPIR